MKIAHIVSTYPPYYSGMGNVVFEMASRLARRGHTVEVFTPEYRRTDVSDEEKKSFTDREDYGRRLRAPITYGNAAYLPELGRTLDSFDIVHLHYPFFGTASLVARWKKRNPKKPLVITYHMDTRASGMKGIFFKLYTKWFMPDVLHAADLLIASSFDYIESSDAREIYRKEKEKWIELPFGVDTERFNLREKPNFLFDRYELNTDMGTIIFVGGMDRAHYFKGIPVLLEALVLCKRSGRPIQAMLVGEGDMRRGYELIAQGMGLGKLVKFVGKVSYDELPLYYSIGDLCVLPSTTRGEAFGMVLLEALASGVPVIASDLPGVRTIALQAGSVCIPGSAQDLADSLQTFFSSGDRKKASCDARKVAEEEYDWEPIVEELEKHYVRLVAS